MKKIWLVFMGVAFLLPICGYASVLDEVPPYIEIEGISEEEYEITKTIGEDIVSVELVNKKTGDAYSWSFEKNKIKEPIHLDFTIKMDSQKQEEIEQITGDMDKVHISFAHHGQLPTNATIKVDVSEKFREGQRLYLYYYNEETKEIEYVSHGLEVKEGFVEFEIDHCSEYLLTGAVVNSAANNPKNLNYVIGVLVLIIIALTGYTLFKRK